MPFETLPFETLPFETLPFENHCNLCKSLNLN